ncbi:MAG: alpha/beta fold hydrolase [Pseudomonadota bacterium]
MHHHNILTALAVASALALSACGGGDSASGASEKTIFGIRVNANTPAGSANGNAAVEVPEVASSGDMTKTDTPITQDRDGTIYRQTIEVNGETHVFQVFEPTRLLAGKTYPLIINGHGWSGMRNVAAPAGSITAQFRDAGYYVISFDQRGFGESGGKVRAMDPEYDGKSLIGILDWAEKLPGLRRKTDGKMVLGSYGGSYGGMFQFLLAGADPKQRLRVIAPDIAPHDLAYSLNQNNVPKSTYLTGLLALAEAPPSLNPLSNSASTPTDPMLAVQTLVARASRGEPTRADTTIIETMGISSLTGFMTETDVNALKYHSVSYFCDGLPAKQQTFTLPGAVPDAFPALVAPKPFPKLDALITIGMSDTLFNFNNGYNNHQCLKRGGGDVRLLTHQSGHILPVSLATVPGAAGLDPLYAAINPPEFQGPGGTTACGSIKMQDAVFAWMEEKLQGKTNAIKNVVTTGKDFCMSIADGDAVQLRDIPRGGASFKVSQATPQFSGPAGVAGSLLGSAVREQLLSVQPLYTAGEDNTVVAGIPTTTLDLTALQPALQMASCPTPVPLGGCDPRFFIGIGKKLAGASTWTLVNGNLTPLRGFGPHAVDLAGISTRLKEGDQLGLLIYAFHAQYATTFSKDLFAPAAFFNGAVQLPILSKTDIVREGV